MDDSEESMNVTGIVGNSGLDHALDLSESGHISPSSTMYPRNFTWLPRDYSSLHGLRLVWWSELGAMSHIVSKYVVNSISLLSKLPVFTIVLSEMFAPGNPLKSYS